ncbi:MAG: hypothetical protein D6687_08990 [Acidobacteria bacterium]|nr:MAG: hypothetical protein D6687_08990 [Acidobacteriota bacterium]
MKIALIGYGSMGKIIKRLAEEKGNEIVAVITSAEATLSEESLAEKLKQADVAIDFSVASAVKRNVSSCLLAGIPQLKEQQVGKRNLK